MRKPALLVLLALAAADASAVRHVVFETDVYNRAFPLECRENVVFSPLAAEIDFAVAAESLDTISRANVAESMGVLVEFSGVYGPLLARLTSVTNGFACVGARGFCLPDLKGARPDYLAQIQRDYGAEVMRLMPAKGAECWFRAAMDGEMEDFSIGPEVAASERYSYFDLVSLRAEWLEPFPTSGVRQLTFEALDKTSPKVAFMSDVRVAETWENREYDILKLPLRNGCSFYAMLPKPGVELGRVREDFSPMEIEALLSMTGETPIGNYRKEPTVVAVPRLDLDTATDFTGAFQFFRVPTSALVRLANGVAANRFVQRARFRLFECGANEVPFADRPPEKQLKVESATRRMILNRPFHYFVYDEQEKTIPVAGQYTGVTAGETHK